jgi:plasmid stability protein
MEAPMAQLLVRNLEDDVKAKLQKRARRHGRSTEEEVREILRNAVKEKAEREEGLGTRIARRFAKVGLRPGEDIPEQRGYPARPAEFDS